MLSKTRKCEKRGSCQTILVNKKPEATDKRDVGCTTEEGNQRRGQGKGGWICGWRLGQGLRWMTTSDVRNLTKNNVLFCLDSAEVNDCDISVP